MSKAPKYFMYFPGNYRWSAAFVNMLGTAPFGGVDISELHAIGRLLEGKSGEDDEAWFDACVKVADTVRGHAEKFRAERSSRMSAASFYLRACHYYQMGERFPHAEGCARARCLSHGRRLLSPVRRAFRLSKIEIVDVPFEGKKLAGLFRAGAERKIRASALHGVLRRPRHHQGNPVSARRARSRPPRHFGAGDGRTRHRRGDPLSRHAAAPRLRKSRQRLHRLSGTARRRRPEADRHYRHQPRRLLRAALRIARAALCRLHRLGRDLGLLRHLEETYRCRLQGVDVGARPSHHVDPRRRYARCGA